MDAQERKRQRNERSGPDFIVKVEGRAIRSMSIYSPYAVCNLIFSVVAPSAIAHLATVVGDVLHARRSENKRVLRCVFGR